MRILGRGRAAQWTKEKIETLTTPDLRNLHANAERLLETEIAALCLEVLGTRPRSGVSAPAKVKPPAKPKRVKAAKAEAKVEEAV